MAIVLNLLMIVNYGIPSLVVDMVGQPLSKKWCVNCTIAQVFWNPIMEAIFFLPGPIIRSFEAVQFWRLQLSQKRVPVYKKMHLGSYHKPPWQRLTPLTSPMHFVFLVFCKSAVRLPVTKKCIILDTSTYDSP